MRIPEYAVRLLRAVPGAAIFVTARGKVLLANESARAALGLETARPPDLDLTTLVVGPADALAGTLRSWSRSTDPVLGSFTLASASGPTTFNGEGAVIFPRDGDSPAILLVRFWRRAEANPFVLLSQKLAELNDEVARRIRVEEALRRSEIALRERAIEAEGLNRTKDEFLATVSHELRTPLNAILGWSSLLRGRGADREAQKGLEVIHRNALSQARLIDDILDVSRIITGKLLLETKPADLAAIAAEAVEAARPSATAKNIEIDLTRPAEGSFLEADPDRLRQVVWNLVSNAVKFTGRGGSVRIVIERRDSQLALTVVDTGSGIEPAFLPHVFDRFRQADSSTTRATSGLGLGLAIVRHIVELHGGTVAAFSEGLGKGASFTIQLPIRAVFSAEPSRETREDVRHEEIRLDPPSLEGVRVLVVDDQDDAREMLAAALAGAGGEVETAASVADAFAALVRSRPDVLVSDIGMPDEDGYSLIDRLRRLGASDGGAIPAVAVTAYTRAEDRTRALDAGFTTHIGKPVSPDELIGVVASLAVSTRR